MIGSTNCGKIKGKPEQLVNYTLLYDFGDECTDITGGWNGTRTFWCTMNKGTKNANNVYLKASGGYSYVAPINEIDFTPYSKILTKINRSHNSDYGWSRIFISPTTVCGATGKIEYAVGDAGDIIMLNDAGTTNTYLTIGQDNTSSGTPATTFYFMSLLKSDDWSTLASIAGITVSSIDDILTNSTTLLSNKNAVEYMIYNCTGDFMGSAIASETFLTALNNSQYKTIIMANEHWAKFLAMVA